MKSKSSSRRRDRSPDDPKSKRARPRSKSREREKVERKDPKSTTRKSRWQPEDDKNSSKNASIPEPVITKEKSGPAPRIKDSLHDKEKIVDLLFQTVTGAALQELIPDYLKKRSTEELKKLCLEQIKTMSDEVILKIISGKVDSSNKEEEVVEKEKILKPEQPSSPKKKEKEVTHSSEKKPEDSNIDVASKLSDSDTQLQAATSIEIEKKAREESEIPVVIKEEIAKDLILPERDAELLELEMRARAIRSLLKAKGHSANEEETTTKKDK